MVTCQTKAQYLNIVATVIGLTSIGLCTVLVLFVRSELADIYPQTLEATTSFQSDSQNIWRSLRDVNINPNVLRNRRETFRKLLGRPLSTSSSVGYSHGKFAGKLNPSSEIRRSPAKKQNSEASHTTIPKSSPKTFGYGIPREKFGGYYAPPHPNLETYSAEPAVYGSYNAPTGAMYPTVDNYDADMTSTAQPPAYGPPVVEISSYSGTFEETNVDEPTADLHWDQIKLPTCNCKADNQCPVGPAGSKGDTGEPGKPGDDGKAGGKGKTADDILLIIPPISHCIMCPQGEVGPPGPEGKRGSRGLRGARGGDGSTGRNGHPGSPGLHGPEGAPGLDGEIGVMGVIGMNGHMVVGLPGQKGISGERGDAGQTGNSGLEGQIGLIGVPGSRGSQGNPGRPGVDGSSGDSGLEGDPGTDAEYCPCPRNRQYDVANRLLRV